MQTDTSTAAEFDGAVAAMPLLAAAELQDHLMTVTNDLERLQRLLDDAGEALSTHFYSASNQTMALLSNSDGSAASDGLKQIMQDIAGAITALQFQDMATQLIKKGTAKRADLRTSGVNTFWGIPAGGVAAASITNRTNMTSSTITYNQARA